MLAPIIYCQTEDINYVFPFQLIPVSRVTIVHTCDMDYAKRIPNYNTYLFF